MFKDGFDGPVADGVWDLGNFVGGFKVDFYDGGKVYYKGGVEGGLFHGRGILYHKSGGVIYQGKFDRGREDFEEAIIYGEGEEICFIGGMRDGRLVGYSETFDGKRRSLDFAGKNMEVSMEDYGVRSSEAAGKGKVRIVDGGEMKKAYCPVF